MDFRRGSQGRMMGRLSRHLLLLAWLVWGVSGASWARLPWPLEPSSTPSASATPVSSPTPSPSASPSPATRAPVSYRGRDTILVSRSGDLSAQERARLLENRMKEVLERCAEAPDVSLSFVSGQAVLQSEGIVLITLTDRDAQLEGTTIPLLAGAWRDALEHQLHRAYREQSFPTPDQARERVLLILLAGGLLHAALRRLARSLRVPAWFAFAAIWLAVAYGCLWQFRETRTWSLQVYRVLHPLLILWVVVGCALALLYATKAFAHRYFEALRELRTEEGLDPRWQQRQELFEQAFQVLMRMVVFVLAIFVLLQQLKVPASILTGAGVVGVTLGVALQDVLKDMIASIYILIEDHFSLGDWIRCGDLEGTVERFNLRATSLRNAEGTLITIPNSSMRIVQNMSNLWAQVDLRVDVHHGTDVAQALKLMEQCAVELREEKPELIQEQPQLRGVDSLVPGGITLRILVKTAPAARVDVKNALLERIVRAFGAAGIRRPEPSLHLHGPLSEAVRRNVSDGSSPKSDL